MGGILQIFYTIFSSLLLFFSLPNDIFKFGSPVLGLLALIPLYFVYLNLKSYKQTFFLFFLHGCLTHLLSSYWLAYFKDFAIITLGASAFGSGLLEAMTGIFMYLPIRVLNNRLTLYSTQKGAILNLIKILWFPSIYIIWEYIKSTGFLGYPWATLSSTVYNWKVFMQIADITGTYGISFLIALFSAIMGEGIHLYSTIHISQNPKRLIFSLFNISSVWTALSVLSFIYGLVQYTMPRTPVKVVNTISVQQNSDPWKNASDNETILLSQDITDQQLNTAKELGVDVDLIVWSEGCLKYQFPSSIPHYERYPYQNPLIPYIRKKQIPFILGGPYVEYLNNERKVFNSSFLFDTDGNFRGKYGKIHLVPIAEAIPFAEIPLIKNFMKSLKVSAGWAPGDQYTYFQIPCHYYQKQRPVVKVISLSKTKEQQELEDKASPYVMISTPICYDDAFPDVMRPLALNGTELFVNITDDSWSMRESAEYQHFVVSSYRSIETRTTIIRSCNSGYSVVLDPAGKVYWDMPVFKATGTLVSIPVYERTITVYMRFGNWLPLTLVLLCLAGGVYFYILQNTNEYPDSERKIKKSKKKKKKNKK